MTRMNRFFALCLAALVAVLASGCPRKAADDLSKGVKGQAEWSKFKRQAAAPAPEVKNEQPAAPPQKKEIAKVDLPASLLATCRVKVGDAVPEAQLPDLGGKPVALRSLFGPKATVILFWSTENLYAKGAFSKFGVRVMEPFGGKGVGTIAIAVKDKAEAVRKEVEARGAKFHNLVDADGSYFAKVATEKLPRIYLLDPAGKVVYFDLEYSDTTHQLLTQGIEALLERKPQVAGVPQ